MLGHAGPLVQVTSQRHDAAQSMDGHDDGPWQAIEHDAAPQLIVPHDAAPWQSMLQFVAAAQSMLSHALPLLHLMVQSKPAGHCRAPHALFELHSIRQVLFARSHDVHGLGHGVSMQYPCSQLRPASHWSVVVQAKRSESRFTEQLLVDAQASPMIARITKIAADLIIGLP